MPPLHLPPIPTAGGAMPPPHVGVGGMMTMPPPPHHHHFLPSGVPPPGAIPMPVLPHHHPPPLPPPAPSSGETTIGSNGDNGGLHLNRHPQNFAQTVVLVGLPPFLRSVRSLRDASHPCGAARTVHVGCCPPGNDVDARKFTERGMTPSIMDGLKWEAANGGIAVVKLGHYGGARDFAGGMMILARCGREGILPSGGDDGIVATTTVEDTDAAVVGPPDDGGDIVVLEAEARGTADDNDDNWRESKTKGEARESSKKHYGEKEEADHLETLRLLSDVRVHHLFNHHIPDPVPPDMIVPQPDPVPDPAVPVRLLETLTALRLRYDESVREAAELVRSGRDPASASSSSSSYVNDDQWGGHAADAGTDDGIEDGVGGGDTVGMMKLDTAKLAAAAGGAAGYDEEADPLNAPEVIKAVIAFKRRLEDQNVKGKKRRIEIVNDRMAKKVAEFLERGRREREEQQLLQRQKQQQQRQEETQQQHQAVEGEEAKLQQDTGRRGVSNLPAWMTKGSATGVVDSESGAAAPPAPEEGVGGGGGSKRKFVPSEANRDINARKQRLEVDGNTSLSEIRAANEAADELRRAEEAVALAAVVPFVAETTNEGILSADSKFPPLSPSASEPLKEYVTSQIVDYLGEEESTLIEFIMKELSKEGGCKTLSLLEEMKMVLDEVSEDFVLGLYRKMLA
ncbi:hypothetical protein ACHAXA_004833 [Cyclostephanos tholiformis]|uniref:PWI domain-containing protein n=1 Tax=Cyclostephanos tholiformis TaxID=382380 RepID=A0ABD3SH00_9STRA